MAEQAPTVIAGQVPRIRDPQFREIYSNVTSGRIGPMDITIVFSRMVELAPGQPVIADQCEITMSPQQCLAVFNQLKQTIDGYQKVFGELTMPEDTVRSTLSSEQMSNLLNAAITRAASARRELAASIMDQAVPQTAPATSSTEPPPPSKQSHGAAPKKGS